MDLMLNLPFSPISSFKLPLKKLKTVLNINTMKQSNPQEKAPPSVAFKCILQEVFELFSLFCFVH